MEHFIMHFLFKVTSSVAQNCDNSYKYESQHVVYEVTEAFGIMDFHFKVTSSVV